MPRKCHQDVGLVEISIRPTIRTYYYCIGMGPLTLPKFTRTIVFRMFMSRHHIFELLFNYRITLLVIMLTMVVPWLLAGTATAARTYNNHMRAASKSLRYSSHADTCTPVPIQTCHGWAATIIEGESNSHPITCSGMVSVGYSGVFRLLWRRCELILRTA